MDALIRKHAVLIFSTLYMVLRLLTAGYLIFYNRQYAMIKDISSATNGLSEKKIKLEQMQKKLTDEEDKSKQEINSLPLFLSRINEIANKNNVVIRKLSPDSSHAFKFVIDMIADYFTFIRFTAALESLDIILDDIQVRPYDANPTPPLHAISFSIIPRNDATPLSENTRLAELQEWVAQKDKRNPFQRFAYDLSLKKVRPVIDLTWIYKLGGIGVTPDGQRYATIDRKEYKVSEKLEDRTITAIESDRVQMEKQTVDGKLNYSLGFRRTENQLKK